MAIRVLLDHDVPEDNIFLVSLLMAEIGVHSIAYAFPKVNLLASAQVFFKIIFSLNRFKLSRRQLIRKLMISFM